MCIVEEFEKVEVMPHSVYSPDRTSLDYHLLRFTAHFLLRKRVNNEKDVEHFSEVFLTAKDKDWY